MALHYMYFTVAMTTAVTMVTMLTAVATCKYHLSKMTHYLISVSSTPWRRLLKSGVLAMHLSRTVEVL